MTDYADYIDISSAIELDVDNAVIESGLARIAVCLCLDTSGSMGGSRIAALNEGLRQFKEQLEKDLRCYKSTDLAIVTFNSTVDVIKNFTPMSHISMPVLTAKGQTHMGEGVLKCLELLEERKQFYQNNGISYYRPMLFVFSDGGQNGNIANFNQACVTVEKYTNTRKVIAFGVAVDKNSDKEELAKITSRKAMELNSCKFNEFFEWLSNSVGCVSKSAVDDVTLALPPVSSWAGWDNV